VHEDAKPAQGILCKASFFMVMIFFTIDSGTVWAEQGSFTQRRACKPDVFRLCGEFIPNSRAITNCLQRNKSRLNPDCRAVFEGKLK